jgi:membrane protease YdiL (CAAX protease family)
MALPEEMQGPAPHAPTWGKLRVAVYSVILIAVYYVVQLITVAIALGIEIARDPGIDVDARSISIASDGDVLAASLIATVLVCTPLLLLLSSRRAPGLRALLGLDAVRPATAFGWLAGIVAMGLATDLLWEAMGREPMVEFMVEVMATTDSLVLLCTAMVLAAPLFEELLFRGFVLEGLRVSGVASWMAVAISAALWAVIHLQYELPEMTLVFLLGLVLGTARVRTGSLLPSVLGHVAWNAISYVQTLNLVRG